MTNDMRKYAKIARLGKFRIFLHFRQMPCFCDTINNFSAPKRRCPKLTVPLWLWCPITKAEDGKRCGKKKNEARICENGPVATPPPRPLGVTLDSTDASHGLGSQFTVLLNRTPRAFAQS